MTVALPVHDARNAFTHTTFEDELAIVHALLVHNSADILGNDKRRTCYCPTCEHLRCRLMAEYIPRSNRTASPYHKRWTHDADASLEDDCDSGDD